MGKPKIYRNFTTVEFYDSYLGNSTEDIPFWLEVTKNDQEILDIGCGTGRVAIPLGIQGKTVYGIDNSMAMLQAFREKINNQYPQLKNQIHIHQQDMRSFHIDKKFHTMIIPDISFNHLATNQDVNDTLQSINQHLFPGGKLILEVINPIRVVTNQTKTIHKHVQTGKYFLTWTLGKYIHDKQIYETANYYQYCDAQGKPENDKITQVNIYYRFYYPQEMDYILEANGFRIINKYGGYDQSPFTGKEDLQIYIVRKNK
ncbi:class I SAM-dependent methyltransferase [Marininema halotolerans]|uniref:Methyltransferase domain-containing protein n=1 Tax=Marininema halotolerans TaxID=1155944 RepID=A0A1I6QDD2_9BACL|nr:class I SAM-dependent methyltransferase [Marininema halotolerans]SFS50491.1 Methyltransferase domain-containing protein [Marininema halotolerans]